MTQFQAGGAKGKGVVDNLFILRGIIDHSVYLKNLLLLHSITLKNVLIAYGLKTALTNCGRMVFRMIQFIYLLNAKASVTVEHTLW